jgi:hypothetical protein
VSKESTAAPDMSTGVALRAALTCYVTYCITCAAAALLNDDQGVEGVRRSWSSVAVGHHVACCCSESKRAGSCRRLHGAVIKGGEVGGGDST